MCSEFGRPVAGDSTVKHHARLTHVPGAGLVEQAAIVPHDGVAGGAPDVVVDPRRLAGGVEEVAQRRLRFVGIHSRNATGMTSDQERGPSRFGVDLDERAERWVLFVKTVAAVLAALLRRVALLRMAVVERMIGRQVGYSRSGAIVEGFVGGSHVGPTCLTGRRRNDVGGEDGPFGHWTIKIRVTECSLLFTCKDRDSRSSRSAIPQKSTPPTFRAAKGTPS